MTLAKPSTGAAFPLPRLYAVLAVWLAGVTSCGRNPQKYIDQGNQFFEAHRWDDAELQYRKALQKNPKSGEAHYRLALIDLERGQSTAAYRELQLAIDLTPDNLPAISRAAQLALRSYHADSKHPPQLYQQAVAAAKLLLAKQPSGYDGNLLQGSIDLIDKKPAEAMAHLRQALLSKPDDPDATLILARALVDAQQADAGLALARQLTEKDKTFGPAYDFLFELYRRAGRAIDAENILRQKVSNNPKQAAFILELGRYYASAGRPTDVEATLKRLTDDPAAFPDGRLLAGDFYTSTGEPGLALSEFEAGLAREKTDKNLYRRRMGALLAAQEKWPQVYEQLQECLRVNPDDEAAKLMRALAWLEEGKIENLDPAIAELNAQLKSHPQDAGVYFQLGNALARKGDQDGARREWAESARQNRQYLPPRYALAQMSLAQHRAEDALRISEDIVVIAPHDAQARVLRVTCQIAAGQFQQAKSELSRMDAEFPRSARVRMTEGVLALSEKRYPDAERIFGKLASSGPGAGDPEVLAGLTEAYLEQKEPGKALGVLEDLLKRSPDPRVPREVLARAAMASGKYDLAVEQYKQLAAAFPASIKVQRALAAAYDTQGNTTAGIGILEAVIQKDPASAEASLELANLLYKSGRLNDAKVQYRRVLKMQPNNADALNDLAYVMVETGENPDEAMALVRTGMQFASDQSLKGSLQDTLGSIYLKKNMYDSALRCFQIAVDSKPGSMTYHYHLGSTLYRMGNQPKAKAELQAALAATLKSGDEAKIRELLARF